MRIKQSIECWLFHRELGKFLLLKCPATPRHPEYWQPVTGGVWQREPLLHACLREVREETGIALNEADVIVIHDEVHVFVAPKLLGGETARSPIDGDGIAQVAEALPIHNPQWQQIGGDLYLSGRLAPSRGRQG